jgi:hypothetical protein
MEKMKDVGKRSAYGDAIRRQNSEMRKFLDLEGSDPISESSREKPAIEKKPAK